MSMIFTIAFGQNIEERDDITNNLLESIEDGDPRIIHVIVALCDNEHQGIVPVSRELGDGDDPVHNLYWGAGYGVKTFFNRSDDWILQIQYGKPSDQILERCVFKHSKEKVYIIADAYRGLAIKKATEDFLCAAAGLNNEQVMISTSADSIKSFLDLCESNMIVYVGHNGLMDFDLEQYPQPSADYKPKDAVILACASKHYFKEILAGLEIFPLIWTEGLCAPEAYVLEEVIDGWLNMEGTEQIRTRAADAYSKYQKCSIRAAKQIFTTGW